MTTLIIGFKSNHTTNQNLRVMYFTEVDNTLSEINKWFYKNCEYLTAVIVFYPISTNFLSDNFVLKWIHDKVDVI